MRRTPAIKSVVGRPTRISKLTAPSRSLFLDRLRARQSPLLPRTADDANQRLGLGVHTLVISLLKPGNAVHTAPRGHSG
jgi:hypothetical protein